jgi:NAD(P)H-hydrate epimerase
MKYTNKSILKKIYKKRPKRKYFRKYDFGLLLVIGGGEFYSGSPALSAMAAFKAGVDMVRIVAPKRAADIIASFSPDLAAFPLEGKWLESRHLSTLLTLTKSAETVSRGNVAVLIGGGVGRTEETQETVLEYLSQISIPAVIDADAIHAIGKNPEIISGKPFLITPHSYEFFVLTGKEVYELSHRKKIKVAKEQAQKLQTTILLKEKPDIITDGKDIVLNKTGSSLMTVGGTGDTLAGICGAFMARRIDPFIAAQAATYINGLAGELAGEKLEESLMATDVVNEITNVLLKFRK